MPKNWDKPQHIPVEYRTNIEEQFFDREAFKRAIADVKLESSAIAFQFVSNCDAGLYDQSQSMLAEHLSTFAPALAAPERFASFYPTRHRQRVDVVYEWVDPLDPRVDANVRAEAAKQRAEKERGGRLVSHAATIEALNARDR